MAPLVSEAALLTSRNYSASAVGHKRVCPASASAALDASTLGLHSSTLGLYLPQHLIYTWFLPGSTLGLHSSTLGLSSSTLGLYLHQHLVYIPQLAWSLPSATTGLYLPQHLVFNCLNIWSLPASTLGLRFSSSTLALSQYLPQPGLGLTGCAVNLALCR